MTQHDRHFSIGQIQFAVSSPFLISAFDSENWEPFLNRVKKSDVKINYHLVEESKPAKTRLNKKQIELLENCSSFRFPIINHVLINSEDVVSFFNNKLKKGVECFVEFSGSSISTLDYSSNETDFFLSPKQGTETAKYFLGPSFVAPYLARYSSMLLHGACATRKGVAFIFTAPDEGGKTTAILLSKKNKIISDDHIILRRLGKHFLAFPTPWAKHRSDASSARVNAIFLLKKAAIFRVVPMKKHEMIKFIWDEHFSYHTHLPKVMKKKAFKLVSDFVGSVSTYALEFPRDCIDWNLIDRLIQE